MTGIIILVAAYILDLVVGDPQWLFHPVRALGTLVSNGERLLRGLLPAKSIFDLIGGAVLVVCVCSVGAAWALLVVTYVSRLSSAGGIAVSVWMASRMIATRSLADSGRTVAHALAHGTLEDGQKTVAMFVGRDTDVLDKAAVCRAAIETVAENTTDGVVAPLFWLSLGGLPALYVYKAVSTMDSMIGYTDKRYFWFGKIAARLDDVMNFVPARMAGLLMVGASFLIGLDARSSLRIYRRDRLKHASPNSAHTEAACAGALGIRLAGPACYHGELSEKPWLGDAVREVVPDDIGNAVRLMHVTGLLMVCVCILAQGAWLWFKV
jgi:adenosylcobinamide-phosphate synthase